MVQLEVDQGGNAVVVLRKRTSDLGWVSSGPFSVTTKRWSAASCTNPKHASKCLLAGQSERHVATGKQLILGKRAAKRPRKKRTRPEPRQYTVADLERARDRVAAAKRRIDNDPMSNSRRGRAGLKTAQLELSVIESQLRSRGLLEW